MQTYSIKTFGCQMNYSDSERVAAVLEQCGFVKAHQDQAPDLQIVNTCSVRQRSEDKAYGFIVSTKKNCPETIVAVTGCMVRQTGDRSSSQDELLRYDPVDVVFRIEDVARLPKLLESRFPTHDFSSYFQHLQIPGSGCLDPGIDSEANYFNVVPKVENKTQVFVPIMQGCDKFCTYCIVPYTRGRESSRPMEDIFSECERHVVNGALEITLLGQNVNSYTDNGKKCFSELLRKIDTLHTKGLSRLRFTSAHPQDFTDDVIDVLAKMKTSCPYIHLPVQHGANRVLRAMNRNYTVEKYESIVYKIRKAIPDAILATDIIVGFPGETESDFQELLDFAKRIEFDFSYTAIFSPRRNTPASRMQKDFISLDEKRGRFHRLDDVVKKTAFAHRDLFLNKDVQILVETSLPQKNGLQLNGGRSREFFEVYFESGRNFIGREVNVCITGRKGYVLEGEAQ
ncbi:tRNA (N6-isopentenyl adenosine(37)-C2)-methylthiotransferase MiaB [Candidatus Gracilibacteria bacterium]|nr:tRNA (N6-isopentenyl adenosine(37)-C2)-methylthiotransferase MiaB [Candidatus Gracilibacteria bacterium]